MARIIVTDKGETREITCKSDGVDLMDDALVEHGVATGESGEWEMTESEFQWWAEWAFREERIQERANELGEDAIEGIVRLSADIDDPDMLQTAQEKYLGMA